MFDLSGDFSPQSDHALPVQAAKHHEPIHPADRRQSFLRWFSFFSLIFPNFAFPISTMSSYTLFERQNDKSSERQTKINKGFIPSPTDRSSSLHYHFVEQGSALRPGFRTDGSVTETIVLNSVRSSALFCPFSSAFMRVSGPF